MSRKETKEKRVKYNDSRSDVTRRHGSVQNDAGRGESDEGRRDEWLRHGLEKIGDIFKSDIGTRGDIAHFSY